MHPDKIYYTDLNPNTAIWFIAIIVAVFGARVVRNFLLFLLTRLYDFFIRHNAAEL